MAFRDEIPDSEEEPLSSSPVKPSYEPEIANEKNDGHDKRGIDAFQSTRSSQDADGPSANPHQIDVRPNTRPQLDHNDDHASTLSEEDPSDDRPTVNHGHDQEHEHLNPVDGETEHDHPSRNDVSNQDGQMRTPAPAPTAALDENPAMNDEQQVIPEPKERLPSEADLPRSLRPGATSSPSSSSSPPSANSTPGDAQTNPVRAEPMDHEIDDVKEDHIITPADSTAHSVQKDATETYHAKETTPVTKSTNAPEPPQAEKANSPAANDASVNPTPQETLLSTLRAQHAALITSLTSLPPIQDLVAEDPDSDLMCHPSLSEPSAADIMAAANRVVKKHIRLLHEYNEIKDVAQGIMGLIADSRGVRIVDVQDEFGVDAND